MAKKVSLIAQLQDKLDRANLLIEEHGVETDDLYALVKLGKAADKLQLYVHQALREALEFSQRRGIKP
jgi:hypothetical protein